ncbi:hypothetical protein [Arabiibacter massiliensis]|uniref:hypothetical protein n=1 Tax=Arabiibacter massiliensis TaxID=1870985 RepID=UPI0009BB2EF8|nr:hypothetical protein [Arabiibacter massiliensis]
MEDVAGNAHRYLKWADDVIGVVCDDLSVSFTQPDYNPTVSLYTRGSHEWTAREFREFLSDRIMSPQRRDIEKLLFRCGLSEYDAFRIADATHAVNPKDELWMAARADDKLADATTDVFESVFLHRIDAEGGSVNTPEGVNVKRYAAFQGKYGIVKQRISPLSTDVESEIAVYLLAREMGIPCCPARRFDADSVFSEFVYDFTKEYLVHLRRLFNGPRGENELDNLLEARPGFADDFHRMILLDFVTRQDDRHLSNMALKMSDMGESFYPLYDNGRSLFYEDTEEMACAAVADPAAHATTFGPVGTYWDHLRDIAARGVDLRSLANLDVPEQTVDALLKEAGFSGYRLPAAREWITRTLAMAREL